MNPDEGAVTLKGNLYIEYVKLVSSQTDSMTSGNVNRRELELSVCRFLDMADSAIKFCSHSFGEIISRTLHEKGTGASFRKMATAFSAFEQLALNLYRFPWRHEFRKILVYTGGFRNKIVINLSGYSIFLEQLGYRRWGDDDERYYLRARTRDIDKLLLLAFDSFVAQVECGILDRIADCVCECGYTLQQILQMRAHKVGDVNDCVAYLLQNVVPRLRPSGSQFEDDRDTRSGTASSTSGAALSGGRTAVAPSMTIPHAAPPGSCTGVAAASTLSRPKRSSGCPTSVVEANPSEFFPELYPPMPGSNPVRRTQSCPRRPLAGRAARAPPTASDSAEGRHRRRIVDEMFLHHVAKSPPASDERPPAWPDGGTLVAARDHSRIVGRRDDDPRGAGGRRDDDQECDAGGRHGNDFQRDAGGRRGEDYPRGASGRRGDGYQHDAGGRRGEEYLRDASPRRGDDNWNDGWSVLGDRTAAGKQAMRTGAGCGAGNASPLASSVAVRPREGGARRKVTPPFPVEPVVRPSRAADARDDPRPPVSVYDNMLPPYEPRFRLDDDWNAREAAGSIADRFSSDPRSLRRGDDQPGGPRDDEDDGDGGDGGGWECERCTYLNAAALSRCEICGAAAALSSSRRRVAGVECPLCTYVNDAAIADCRMCSTALAGPSTYM